ncbi:MAG: hypothetical protein BGO10_08420 [Chlamydia sp. 32-24]|nr:MAG: hypothetical protein BGO10_08420 [Chlamydia sp. 32-24]
MPVYKRKDRNGKVTGWRAVVRIKGYPTVCKEFERKQEADDWKLAVTRKIKAGQFQFDQHKIQRTFSDLVDHFIQSGALEHHRSAKGTVRHLEYWKSRLGEFALVYLTSERLGKERQLLIDTPTPRNAKKSSATVNLYMASLSACLTYACRQLRWMDDNPCFNLIKLKEGSARDHVLTQDEVQRLFEACRESRNDYLYCIVLMAFTTGMRQGEILNLAWNHVDLENRLAHLKETKNGTARSTPLVDGVVNELNRFLKTRDPAKRLIFASKTALGHKTLQMLERYTHLDAQSTRHLSEKAEKQFEIATNE